MWNDIDSAIDSALNTVARDAVSANQSTSKSSGSVAEKMEDLSDAEMGRLIELYQNQANLYNINKHMRVPWPRQAKGDIPS